MSTYTRITKSNGTTEWASGETITHTEHNNEWNTFLTDYNGGITNANISGSAAIANSKLVDIAMSKVLDLADDIATYSGTTTPGDTASPSLPTNLSEEMTRLRYRIAANRRYLTNVYYMNSSGTATAASWLEPSPVGPNLLPNPGFEVPLASSTSAPSGWTLVSTPSLLAIENPAFPTYGLEKRSLNITTNGANEGISVDVGGLKSGAKYLIGMAYTLTDNGNPTPGVLRLSTTNGLASGNYRNLVLDTSTEAASTVVVVNGIVKAQTPAVTMTVSITATTAGADFNILEVWMYELSDGYPVDLPSIPTQTASVSTATSGMTGWTGTGNAWRTDTLSGLSLTAYVPAAGYRLIYEVSVPIRSTNNSDEGLIAYGAIQRNVDGGGASTVVGPSFFEGHAVSSNGTFGHTFNMRYVLDNPTPGSSYAMTFLLGAYDAADYADVIAYPLVNTVQMAGNARLILERL